MTARVVPDKPGWWWAEGFCEPIRLISDNDGQLVDAAYVTADVYDWRAPVLTPEEADALRQRAETAEAELQQLRTRHAELRRLAGELADAAGHAVITLEDEDLTDEAFDLEAAARGLANHLESELEYLGPDGSVIWPKDGAS